MKKLLTKVFPVFAVAAVLVNWILPMWHELDLEDKIVYYNSIDRTDIGSELRGELARKNFPSPAYTYEHLHAVFSNTSFENDATQDQNQALQNYYRKLSESIDIPQKNLGYFGMGLIYYELHLFDESFFEFDRLPQSYPFVNYLKGKYLHFINYSFSKSFYLKEIAVDGAVNRAKKSLSELMIFHQEYEDLHWLVSEYGEQGIPTNSLRENYFQQGDWLPYFRVLVKGVFHHNSWLGVLGALMITVTWLIYLVMIRRRNRFIWGAAIFAFLLGATFSFITPLASDLLQAAFDLQLTGYIPWDLVYVLVNVSLVEELVKAFAFLLLLALVPGKKDPIDYLIYASIVALGFSFVENVAYFETTGIKTMQGRALTSTVIHLFNSSLFAYGLVVGRFSKRRSTFVVTVLFLLFAVLSHTFYDVWLLNSFLRKFSFLTFFWLLISMIMWASMMNNCINNSFNSQARWQYDPKKTNSFLLYALSFIFLFQYLLVAFRYGPSAANYELLKDFASGLFLLVFLTISLSKFDFVPYYWAPLKIWDWDVFLNMPLMQAEYYDYRAIEGTMIRLSSFGEENSFSQQLPVLGRIRKRELLEWEKDWYSVVLDRSLIVGGKAHKFLLIKTKFESELLLAKEHQIVQVRLVKTQDSLEERKKRKRDFYLLGSARILKTEV